MPDWRTPMEQGSYLRLALQRWRLGKIAKDLAKTARLPYTPSLIPFGEGNTLLFYKTPAQASKLVHLASFSSQGIVVTLNKWEETLNTFDTMISHFEGRTNMRGLPFIGMRRLFTQLQTCLVVLLIFILWRRISPIFLKPNSELSLIDQWRFPNDTPKIRRSLPRHPVDSSFTIRRRIAEPASTLIDSNHNHPPCQPPTIPQEAREGQISFSTLTKPKGCLHSEVWNQQKGHLGCQPSGNNKEQNLNG